MRISLMLPAAVLLVPLVLAGCASQEPNVAATKSEEPVVHEYKTGSIMATRERRPVTEEEKRRAEEIAAGIRASQGMPSSRNP